MINNVNYQRILDSTLVEVSKKSKLPTLLLHSCCAPCSSYVLEFLTEYFDIYILFYNPNIYPQEEFNNRVKEQTRLIDSIPHINKIELYVDDYNPEEFYVAVKGYENCPEGEDRCLKCYELRLEKTALLAKEKGFDYFTTTLTISPLKNSGIINEIGVKISEKYGVNYLLSDFKKRNGYKRSIELSNKYNLYRQNYCGCIYSMRGN